MTQQSELETARIVAGVVMRVGVLLALIAWCWWIARPFVVPVIWGIIIAIAFHPAFRRVKALLGGRGRLAAALLTTTALLVLIAPVALLTAALVSNVTDLASSLINGRITVPPPPEKLAEIPIVGEPLGHLWALASVNLAEALGEVTPQLRIIGLWLLSFVSDTVLAALSFVVAMIVAGIMLAYASRGHGVADAVATRLVGARGPELAHLAELTVRNVARGIVGTAFIQAAFCGIGFVAIGLPGAAILALICFIFGVVQIGTVIVLVPTVIYVFAIADTLPAVLYLLWCLPVSVIDNVLRPLLLSQGASAPTVLVLLGVLGGLLAHGLIGLFIGPIVLALCYELFRAWLRGPETAPSLVEVGRSP